MAGSSDGNDADAALAGRENGGPNPLLEADDQGVSVF